MTESSPSERRNRDQMPHALAVCGRELERLLAQRASKEQLREPVLAYVKAVRQVGAPPERALAAFKAMLATVHAIQSRVLTERGDLASSLTQAVIMAYYDTEPQPSRATRAP